MATPRSFHAICGQFMPSISSVGGSGGNGLFIDICAVVTVRFRIDNFKTVRTRFDNFKKVVKS